MRLGLGLGYGSNGKPIVTDVNLLMVGDSIANGQFTVTGATTATNSALVTAGFKTGTIIDFAQGGMHLYKTIAQENDPTEVLYLWDDDLNEKSARYDVLVAAPNPDVDKNAPQIALFFLGINDGNSSTEAATSTHTVAKYQAEYQALIDFMRTDFPNVRILGLSKPARNNQARFATQILNNIREAIDNVVTANNDVVDGVEWHDLDNVDEVHPPDSVRNGEFATRIGRWTARQLNKISTGGIGPRINSADLLLDRIRCSVIHDEGTDITIPAANGDRAFSTEINGTEVVPTGLIKVNNTTFDVLLPEGRGGEALTTELWHGYGQMEKVSRTDPQVIVDNATNALPVRLKQIIANAETEVFKNLTNLHTYFGARPSAKTYTSGALVNQIDGLFSSNNCVTDAGREPTYDGTLFGGAGGLTSADATTHLESATSIDTAASGTSFYIVFKSPPALTAEVPVFAYANQFHSSNIRSKLVISTGGVLRWYDDEGDGFVDISTIGVGSTHFLAMTFNSDGTEAKYSLDGADWTTFNPHNIYLTQTEFIMFAAQATFNAVIGLEIGMCAVTESYWDESSDPSLEAMWSQAQTLYGI